MNCAECDWEKGFYLDLMLFEDAFFKDCERKLNFKTLFSKAREELPQLLR